MTGPENRLRSLRGLDVPDPESVSSLRHRLARRRRRHSFVAVTAATVLAAGIAVAWPSNDAPADVQTVDGTDSTTSSTTTTVTTTPVTPTSVLGPSRTPTVGAYVTASPDGVVIRSGDDTVQVSTTAASAAFAPAPDIVVFQDALTDFDEFPPNPEGSVRVWTDGSVRELPDGADPRSVLLLDATMLHGSPVALIAESHGGVGPDDTFEELVLVDLVDGARDTVVRRPSWESSHFGGRILPDGNVVGLFASESLVLLAHWTAADEQPLWTVELGRDIPRPSVTLRDGLVGVVESSFDPNQGFAPVLTVTTYDLEGAVESVESGAIDDSDTEITTGLLCTGWVDSWQLVCGRAQSPPIVVSVATGEFASLPGEAGAIPVAASG